MEHSVLQTDEEPACSKHYMLCDSSLLINLLIFLELLVLPTLHSLILAFP